MSTPLVQQGKCVVTTAHSVRFISKLGTAILNLKIKQIHTSVGISMAVAALLLDFRQILFK